MIKKFNMILILLLLLFVCIGAVSAVDDSNDTIAINEISDNGNGILSVSEYTVTPQNYNSYFSSNGGKLIDSAVNVGDTITLSGDFSSKNFTITKNITLQGSGATINQGSINLKSGASGCVIKDITIRNNGNSLPGVFVDGASYCTIDNLDIKNGGLSSFPICLNPNSNYNNITNNRIETFGVTITHSTKSISAIVLGSANNNYIAGNELYVSDANAIYLSNYGSGIFKGGYSFNNVIYNNTIMFIVNVTSWAYGIQMMGGNNTADSNRIIGAYRGVSSSNHPSNKAINNLIYIEGKDFSTNATTGGDYGIALASNSTIRNNTINGAFVGAGISAGDDSVIENNYVNASKGYAINVDADNVKVINNEIYTASSAGIFQQGKYYDLFVDRNTIVSESGIGVLVSKSSNTKFPSNITITNNKITTTNKYIINAADADKNAYLIENNQGSGLILTPAGEVDPTVPVFVFNGTTHIITPETYHAFIDADGNLMSDVINDGDILYFNGTFNDKQIIISRSVKLTGLNPKFNNSTFIVTSDSVWIENLTISNIGAERYNAWGIFVADTQIVKIVNNNIEVHDPAAAYALYIYMSSKVYVDNNTMNSIGDSLTYTVLGYGAEECEFTNNTINCWGTGEIHSFEDSNNINANTSEVCIGHCLGDILKEHCLDGTNIIPEIYRTYGVLMIKSSNNTLNHNIIMAHSFVNQMLAPNSTNSIVGVDFYYDCDNNLVLDNWILVSGYDNYIYGAGAIAYPTGQPSAYTAKNNTFKDNHITVLGYNVCEGLIFGQGCSDTNVINNLIELNYERTGYGITLEMSNNSTIEGNTINFKADIGYGIEAFLSSDNIIENNTITGEGKVISGIAGINTKNNVIQNNNITSNGDGSDLGFIMHDVIQAPNSGIFLDGNSSGNIIDSNNIKTQNGYPVDLSTEATSNNITKNYLKGKEGSADEGVNNSESNIVKDNYGYEFDNVTMDNVTADYRGPVTITIAGDESYEGAVVVFKLGDVIIGNATFENGEAILNYTLNETYNVGNYNITAILNKYGFKSREVTALLKVIKSALSVNVKDVAVKPDSTARFVAILIDKNNNAVSGVEVKFYRSTYYIGSAVSDENGVATANIKISGSVPEGNYTIFAKVADSDNYNQSIGSAILVISKNVKIETEIIADNIEMYCKDGTRFVATIKDVSGKGLSGLTIECIINGAKREITSNETGKISFGINLNPGEYLVELIFNGDSNYSASSTNATVKIIPTLTGNDIVMMFRNGTRYEVSLMQNGTPIANEEVDLNINGVIYHRTTDAEGKASLAINLNPNKYIITAYRTSTGEVTSNTIDIQSLLTENKDIEMYYRNGTGYTVKVYNKDGTVAGAGVNVTFNINGVMYERKTNESGIARLNLNLNPGDYIITAMYDECLVANSIKIKPVIESSDLTKIQGGPEPFTVKLVDGTGLPQANATVSFNINGVFYNRTTNGSGVASLNINLVQGQYIITSKYGDAVTSNMVTVKPRG